MFILLLQNSFSDIRFFRIYHWWHIYRLNDFIYSLKWKSIEICPTSELNVPNTGFKGYIRKFTPN